MKRSNKNVVKAAKTQRSISSYFSPSPTSLGEEISKSSFTIRENEDKTNIFDASNESIKPISQEHLNREDVLVPVNRDSDISSIRPKHESVRDPSPLRRPKKRTRENESSPSASPDVIPPTPSPEAIFRPKPKRSSLRANNTTEQKSESSSPCSHYTIIKQHEAESLNTFKENCNSKKENSSTRKLLFDLSTVTIPSKICPKEPSPLKTEEDEVLNSILEQLSPKQSKVSATSTRSVPLNYPPLPLTPSNIIPEENNKIETSSSRKSEKYCFSPNYAVGKIFDHSNTSAEMNKDIEKGFIALDPPLVRRSPRKHGALQMNVDSSEITMGASFLHQVSSKTTESGEKRNKVLLSNVRRSPRKHASSFSPCKAVSNNSHHTNEVKGNSDVGAIIKQPCLPSKHGNYLNEFDESHDEHDDIISYMANMKEEDISPLDFHEAQLCEVKSVVIVVPHLEVILHVRSTDKRREASCRVRGHWLACPVFEGDAISLQAVKDGDDWLLDNTKGFLVLHPDLLISGTAIVGSLFCSRRSVLSSLFRGMDSDSAVMVTGSIVHELLQMVLQQQKFLEPEVRQLSNKLISSKKCIHMLHAANMTVAHIRKEIELFIPRIVDFVQKYVAKPQEPMKPLKNFLGAPASSSLSSYQSSSPQSRERNNHPEDWNGKIIGIRDIEETLWEPRLGIKGMVDVSVEVEDSHHNRKIMPLELKTGKASFSAEHRGQVTLYTMMMSRLEQQVESGLLLYLREGRVQEVSVSFSERKDLIHLRNNLAQFLLPRIPRIDKESGQFVPPKLPEPINFENACKKCSYATLCSVYLKQDGLSDLSPNHPMHSVSVSKSQHLTQSHIDYLMHWVGLLLLEETDNLRSDKLRHIWRFSPEEREARKQAIVNLHLLKPAVAHNGKFYHTFSRQASSSRLNPLTTDLRKTGLSSGDFILISTDKRLAVDRGNIIEIELSSVTVSTNRDLFERYSGETFHLDASESNTVLVFNLTNLGCLLEDTEAAKELRRIIIDRAKPTFSLKVKRSLIQDCLSIFGKLNKNQRNALMKTLQCDRYLLIKGLPGTGKTATMVAMVELLVRAGFSILITSHTHSAVDNLLLRLKEVGLQFLRLGSETRIHPLLHPYSENSLTKHCTTPEELDLVYNKQQIVGVTCLGAGHAMLSNRRVFDICLVDESTQVLQPAILRPLFSARRFVLVGDPEQLPPVVQSHQAQELGLSESLFTRLDTEPATVSLTLNYRMNQVITELANRLTYGGVLKCGNLEVANATLHLVSPQVKIKEWLAKALSTDLEDSVVFVDTSQAKTDFQQNENEVNSDNVGNSACCNQFEKELVVELLSALVDAGVNNDAIGVMAPYRAQVSLLNQELKRIPKISEVEVSTVDQFQGRDKKVIVYSCTRSDGRPNSKPREHEILNDKRRLTVAVTRAKHKLIFLGHSDTLKQYAPFQTLLSCLCRRNFVSIPP